LKVFRAKSAENIHAFIYGYPGCGKTKFIADFHTAGQPVAVVAGFNSSRTLELQGADCPIIVPSSIEELIAIVQMPEEVIAKVIHPVFPDYVVKTWAFDVIKDLQMMILGEDRMNKTQIFDGAMEFTQAATGIMAMPNHRDVGPANKDYRVLDMRLRSLLRSIEQMRYHTIVTAHAERDYTPDTVKKLTGDIKLDKDIKSTAVMTGYPSLEGFSAKSDISGLAGEMLLYLESPKGTEYLMYPKPHHQGFHARTQMAEHMPPRIDWTGKNAFEMLTKLINDAKGKK
jgi:predicted ATPase